MRKSYLVILLIVLIAFAVSIFVYPQMPNRIASHWNAKGEVDGYMPKFWGLFFMPFILVFLALLFIIVPRLDPLRDNIEQFRKYFDGFIILFFIFMLCVHLLIVFWNKGVKISPNIFMPIGVGILFFYIGILCENTKRNWFIGIRTPWTLSSDRVWDKTHRIGAKLFKIAGIIAILGVFFRELAVWFIIVPVIFVAICTIVYSYVEFKKEKK